MLGQNLKKIREARNYTQEDLSVHLQIKRQTYSAYERGVSIPDALTLSKIADFFSISTDSLLGRNTTGNLPQVQNKELDRILTRIKLQIINELTHYIGYQDTDFVIGEMIDKTSKIISDIQDNSKADNSISVAARGNSEKEFLLTFEERKEIGQIVKDAENDDNSDLI